MAMTAELGHFALILALCVACAQAIVPLLGAAWGEARLTDAILPKLGQRAIETARALVGRLLEIAPNDD